MKLLNFILLFFLFSITLGQQQYQPNKNNFQENDNNAQPNDNNEQPNDNNEQMNPNNEQVNTLNHNNAEDFSNNNNRHHNIHINDQDGTSSSEVQWDNIAQNSLNEETNSAQNNGKNNNNYYPTNSKTKIYNSHNLQESNNDYNKENTNYENNIENPNEDNYSHNENDFGNPDPGFNPNEPPSTITTHSKIESNIGPSPYPDDNAAQNELNEIQNENNGNPTNTDNNNNPNDKHTHDVPKVLTTTTIEERNEGHFWEVIVVMILSIVSAGIVIFAFGFSMAYIVLWKSKRSGYESF